jgi:hypothetical protein
MDVEQAALTPFSKLLMFLVLPVIVLLGYWLTVQGCAPFELAAYGAIGGICYGWLGLIGFKTWLAGCDPTVARAWGMVFQTGRTRVLTIVLTSLMYLLVLFLKRQSPLNVTAIFVFTVLLVGLPAELLLIRAFMRSKE